MTLCIQNYSDEKPNRWVVPRVLTADEEKKRAEIVAKVKERAEANNALWSGFWYSWYTVDDIENQTYNMAEKAIEDTEKPEIDLQEMQSLAKSENLDEILDWLLWWEKLFLLQNESLKWENSVLAKRILSEILRNIADLILSSINPQNKYYEVLWKLSQNSEAVQKAVFDLNTMIWDSVDLNNDIKSKILLEKNSDILLWIVFHNSRRVWNEFVLDDALKALTSQNLSEDSIKTLSWLVANKMKTSDKSIMYWAYMNIIKITNEKVADKNTKKEIDEILLPLKDKAWLFISNGVDFKIDELKNLLSEINNTKNPTIEAMQDFKGQISKAISELNQTINYMNVVKYVFVNIDFEDRLEDSRSLLTSFESINNTLSKAIKKDIEQRTSEKMSKFNK